MPGARQAGRVRLRTARPRQRGSVASAHFVLSRHVPGGQAKAVEHTGEVLLIAIPKRLLARAVDRNTVRRIVREAWRACPDATRARAPMLLRLVRRPAGFDDLTQRARKRLWRDELDALLARETDA